MADPHPIAAVPVMARIDWGRQTSSLPLCREWEHAVIYKGVEYTVVATAEPDIWEWRFQIGGKVKTGKTQTRGAAWPPRRVQSKIAAPLRAARSAPASRDR